MKRLLLAPLLLTLFIASCSSKKKYNSYRQANDACKEWASKDGYYIQRYPAYTDNGYIGREVEYKHSLRFCEEEKKTKQVLGIQTTNRKDGEILYPKDNVPCKELISISSCNFRWGNDETRVDKNFYY